MKCQCPPSPVPFLCPRSGCLTPARAQEVCSGVARSGHPPVTPADQKKYSAWFAAGNCFGGGRGNPSDEKEHHEPDEIILTPSGPKPASTPCLHRGDVLRVVSCKPCMNRGQKETPIHACAVHGECALRAGVLAQGMTGRPVHSCFLCPDFREVSPADSS